MTLTNFFRNPIRGCGTGLLFGVASFAVASKNQDIRCLRDLDYIQTALDNAILQGVIGAGYGLCAMLIQGSLISKPMLYLISQIMTALSVIQTMTLTDIKCVRMPGSIHQTLGMSFSA